MFPTLRDLCISLLLRSHTTIELLPLPTDLLEEMLSIRKAEMVELNRLFKNGRPGLYKLIESPEKGLKISLLRGYHQQAWYFLAQGAGNLPHAVTCAARMNNKEMVKFLIRKIEDIIDFSQCILIEGMSKDLSEVLYGVMCDGLRGAAEGGHLSLVEFFIAKGALWWWDGASYGAARGGHLNLVKFFKKRGICELNNWDSRGTMKQAIRGGQLEIVKFLIREDGSLSEKELYLAARSKCLPLIDFLIERGANDWEEGLRGAARKGDTSLVEFFISKGANNWNKGLIGAARGGYLPLVKFFIEKGANDWNGGLHRAARVGHHGLVNLFLDKGACDLNRALRRAAKSGNLALVKFFISKGAKERNRALLSASREENKRITRYLRKKLSH